MTRHQQRLAEAIVIHLGRPEIRPLVEELILGGVIDSGRAERLAIRQRYAEYLRCGELRCQAMVNLSEEFDCSYEKIRKIIYQKE